MAAGHATDAHAVRAAWERAAAAWPGLPVRFEDFAAYLAERAPAVAGAEPRAEDLFLACACLERVSGAVDRFDAALWPRIVPHLRRIEPDEERLGELRQELLLRLFVPAEPGQPPKIAEYTGRGPLHAWVRMAATRLTLNARRGSRSVPVDGSFVNRLARSTLDIELSFIRGLHEEDFRAALREGLERLEPEQRLVLKMHHREGLTMDGLATALGLSRSAAHRRLAAAREELGERVREGLKQRLKLSDSAFESLLRLLDSRLVPALNAELREGLCG